MTSSPLRRWIAWLGLAVALLLCVTPRQGFVLCVEADGCLSVAPSLEREHCGGCKPHEVALATSDAERAAPAGEAPCPCLDVEVPGTAEAKRATSHSTTAFVSVAVGLAARAVAWAPPAPSPCCALRASAVPRPPLLFEHVASVVLRV